MSVNFHLIPPRNDKSSCGTLQGAGSLQAGWEGAGLSRDVVCRRVEKVLDRAAMWSDTLKSTVSVSPSLFSQFFSQTREHYVRRSEEVQVMLEIWSENSSCMKLLLVWFQWSVLLISDEAVSYYTDLLSALIFYLYYFILIRILTATFYFYFTLWRFEALRGWKTRK